MKHFNVANSLIFDFLGPEIKFDFSFRSLLVVHRFNFSKNV